MVDVDFLYRAWCVSGYVVMAADGGPCHHHGKKNSDQSNGRRPKDIQSCTAFIGHAG
jgi:hypothetical protein